MARVGKPLASAVRVVAAGNRVVFQPAEFGESFIENIQTLENMEVREHKGTYVFDVVYEQNGEKDIVIHDSGAGVSVWPKGKLPEVKMEPKLKGLKMIAANGSSIENFGQKTLAFRGAVAAESSPVFNGPTR